MKAFFGLFFALSIGFTAHAKVEIHSGDVVSVHRLKTPTAEGFNLLVRSLAYADQPGRGFFYLAKEDSELIGPWRSEKIDAEVSRGGFNPHHEFFTQYRMGLKGPQDYIGLPIRSGVRALLNKDNVQIEFAQIENEAPTLKGIFHGNPIDTELETVPGLIPITPDVEIYELVNERRALEVNGQLADTFALFHFGYDTSTMVVFDNGSSHGGNVTGHRLNVVFGKMTSRGIIPLLSKEGTRAGWNSAVRILNRGAVTPRSTLLQLDPDRMIVRLGEGAGEFLRLKHPAPTAPVFADSIYGYRHQLYTNSSFNYSPPGFKVAFANRKIICENALLGNLEVGLVGKKP